MEQATVEIHTFEELDEFFKTLPDGTQVAGPDTRSLNAGAFDQAELTLPDGTVQTIFYDGPPASWYFEAC